MSKFDQLREEVSTRVTLEKEYWDCLYEVVRGFPNGFRNYLGIESNEILDINGHKKSIVSVGRVKDGKFVVCAPWDYEKDGKEISFILYLFLPNKESMEIQMTSWTKIRLSKPLIDKDAINISTEDMYHPILCMKEDGAFNLTPFFDELFLELIKKISIESL